MPLLAGIFGKVATSMTVSIIIPTYNGANKILNVLGALEQQTYQNFETLVVINGATDNTVQVVNNASLKLASLRVIEQKTGVELPCETEVHKRQMVTY